MFTATLFVTAPNFKQSKCLVIDKWLNYSTSPSENIPRQQGVLTHKTTYGSKGYYIK